MSRKKIINDPIYGLISFPFDLIYEIIDHPIFQRLRRISQMGLSNYVYPGATHSRFAHALGALHLMTTAIQTLKSKNIDITEEEYLGVCLAILLHDVGHGPFSHALEKILIETDHENISLALMNQLNQEFDGALDLTIEIFTGKYEKTFLTQLVSSQLDMDRMDYLTRDSYYSGVAEGVIGYNRIISMLNVVDNELVVEEKGIFSIEKFLVARHIMYWQVYLHKTSIAAEQMLKKFMQRVKVLVRDSNYKISNPHLEKLLCNSSNIGSNFDYLLNSFTILDDVDVFTLIKESTSSADQVLAILADGLINRRLFKVILQKKPINSDLIDQIRQKVKNVKNLTSIDIDQLLITGQERNKAYDIEDKEIKVLKKSGETVDISNYHDMLVNITDITKHYLCYPK